MYDLIFKSGRVFDGTGNPLFKAGVAIGSERVEAVATRIKGKAERVVDVSGLVVTPGVIDIHAIYKLKKGKK